MSNKDFYEEKKEENSVRYNFMVSTLAKSPEQILKEITPHQMSCLHAAVGVSGEAGELLDSIKKYVIYNKPLDLENVIEELGDLEFYMEDLRQRVGITRKMCLDRNEAKLKKRYPEGFTDSAARYRADKQLSPLDIDADTRAEGQRAAIYHQSKDPSRS
jgi:NTP pyrophosphatase (non-canonical NTP hydrolase)